MATYWGEHSVEASVEEMMLDDSAEILGVMEVKEIMNLLPDVKGKDVLELGAGIGRYTGHLAKEGARHVTALDFMENFILKNKELNGHHKNITFVCQDVLKFDIEPNSVDIIFSNWLFMYMDDEEVRNVLSKMLSWLRPRGTLFFRESCFQQSGNHSRNFNPTKYRSPEEYQDFVNSVSTSKGHVTTRFEVVLSRPIKAYIEVKQNRNQICWLYNKVEDAAIFNNGYKTFQQFLDNQQYSKNGILRYEKIFGKHFVSTGGKETTKEFVSMLGLKAGQVVLDVGCGIGGSAFYMTEKYGVNVIGIDLSSNMINIAMERANDLNNLKVEFELADVTRRQYPAESFDVIYSRDTILHINDKQTLFKSFMSWLKPGGKLLISDYCCSEGLHTEIFKTYVAQRGYNLLSVIEYGKLLQTAGFVHVQSMDNTKQFSEVLTRELKQAQEIRQSFIKEFSEKDYQDIEDGWKSKLRRVTDEGNQRWGLFYAEKGQ